MTRTKADLDRAFVEGLQLPADTAVRGLTYRGIEQWSSLGHMQLVASIEGTFDVVLETEQILDMSSYDKAVEILAAHGIALAD